MNPSVHSSVHTATHAYSYTSTAAFHDQTRTYHSYADYASGLYEDSLFSTESWSGEYAGLGPCSDADRALFEAFLTIDVANTSPSGPCTVVPMQSPPSYYSEPVPIFSPHPIKASQLRPELLSVAQPYLYAASSSQSVSPTFEQAFPEMTASPISPAIYSPLQHIYTLEEEVSTTVMSEPSCADQHIGHHSLLCYPYPSPSPEPSPRLPPIAIVSTPQCMRARADHSSSPLACDYPLAERTTTCVSPDVICSSAHCRYGLQRNGLQDGHSTDAKSRSSRTSRRATRHSSHSAPYPTPSPEPFLRTSSSIVASRRRNAFAPAATPVSLETWQCPYCPHVQRNRRSPDLKRHIKTHTRDEVVADWVCCGVPVMNATELDVSATAMREGQVFDFDGVLMIGGCRKAFSRRDALKRHLQREKGKCFGDALSLHQRGNRERAVDVEVLSSSLSST